MPLPGQPTWPGGAVEEVGEKTREGDDGEDRGEEMAGDAATTYHAMAVRPPCRDNFGKVVKSHTHLNGSLRHLQQAPFGVDGGNIRADSNSDWPGCLRTFYVHELGSCMIKHRR